jgi:hypothetical protein
MTLQATACSRFEVTDVSATTCQQPARRDKLE